MTVWQRQPDGAYADIVYRAGKVQPLSFPGVEIDLDALTAWRDAAVSD